MTCQECQPLAIDLARGLPPFDVGGAVQRADLLSHIATCKRCAQWLREQEALSDALRAATAADAAMSAPAGVEANVMAAWRARQTQQAATTLAANLRSHRARQTQQPAQTQRPSWPAGRAAGFAAAATIIIAALTMASLRWLTPTPAPAPGPTVGAGTSNAAGASTSPSASSPIAGRSGDRAVESPGAPVTGTPGTRTPGIATQATDTPAAGTNAAVIEVLPDKGKKTTKGRPVPPRITASHAANAMGFNAERGPRAARAPLRESASTGQLALASRAGGGGTRGANASRVASATHRGATASRGSTTRAVNAAREASEFSGPAFVLLPYVEPLRPTEMRHIMRVRMPRAQLAAGELRAGGVDDATVLADVLVGEDGTARAVRIVQ